MSHPASGWLILDKPRGMGSTQAVGAVKRVLRQGGHAKTKVGHGGTLDPLAEGVLPIALGEATKLAGRMLESDKIYAFTIQFGEETDTLDTEGEVVRTSDRRPPIAAVAAVLDHFTGEIEQLSLIHADGPPSRAGEELTSAFATTLGRPDPYDPQAPLELADSVTLVAHVSKGTYIRSLARDIAHALGTVGHVTYLRRIKAGPFREEQAISLDTLEEIAKGAPLEHLLLPLEAGLDDIPVLPLDPTSVQAVRQGRVLSELSQPDGLHLAKLGAVPIALMEIEGGTARVVRGFNLPDVAE